MQLATFTIEDIRSWGPCYDPGRFLPEGWQGTAVDILRVTECPIDDRMWVICREEEKTGIPEETWRAWARWCALQVIGLWNAPEIVRQYLETGDESIRAAAWDAARDAAGAAARFEKELDWQKARLIDLVAAGKVVGHTVERLRGEANEAQS